MYWVSIEGISSNDWNGLICWLYPIMGSCHEPWLEFGIPINEEKNNISSKKILLYNLEDWESGAQKNQTNVIFETQNPNRTLKNTYIIWSGSQNRLIWGWRLVQAVVDAPVLSFGCWCSWSWFRIIWYILSRFFRQMSMLKIHIVEDILALA